MLLSIQENIIRFNCKQRSLQNHITPTSRVKVRDGSDNVRLKNSKRDYVLYSSVYLDIISMGGKGFVIIQ